MKSPNHPVYYQYSSASTIYSLPNLPCVQGVIGSCFLNVFITCQRNIAALTSIIHKAHVSHLLIKWLYKAANYCLIGSALHFIITTLLYWQQVAVKRESNIMDDNPTIEAISAFGYKGVSGNLASVGLRWVFSEQPKGPHEGFEKKIQCIFTAHNQSSGTL